SLLLIFLFLIPRPPSSPLFPYTTLFRSRLIHRTSRRLSLTDAGQAYVAASKRILEDIGDAERAAAGEYSAPRGDLAMTAPIVFGDRKSTRLNSSHGSISYAVFCLKKKKN